MAPFVSLDKYNKPWLDLEAFGTALAAELGFPVEVKERGSYPIVNIKAGDALELSLRANWGAQFDRVELNAYVDGAGRLEHHARPSVPGITVHSARPLAALAADVKRRLVVPGREVAKRTLELLAERDQENQAMRALVDELTASYPGLSVNLERDGRTANVYFNRAGCYLTANLWADGKLAIQRFSVGTVAQSRELLDLIVRQQ